MKLAVLSDTRLPTSPYMPMHGLGHIMYAIASGLQARGHEVTLFAGRGSHFNGELITADDERQFIAHDFRPYDAILDGGHMHTLARKLPGLPVVNLSHDRESRPGTCAVFPSAAHRTHHGYSERDGKVIHNGVAIPDERPRTATARYFAYLSMFHAPKAPVMAFEAARLAGVPLKMAGITPPAPPPGCDYVGPLVGDDKLNFLNNATALLFGASTEAGPVTVLEAQSVGCPVIVSEYGAASENMVDGVTGFVVSDTLDMAAAIERIGDIDRRACRAWIAANRSVDGMVDKYNALLLSVAAGERW